MATSGQLGVVTRVIGQVDKAIPTGILVSGPPPAPKYHQFL